MCFPNFQVRECLAIARPDVEGVLVDPQGTTKRYFSGLCEQHLLDQLLCCPTALQSTYVADVKATGAGSSAYATWEMPFRGAM